MKKKKNKVVVPPWKRTVLLLWKQQAVRTLVYSSVIVFAVLTPWYLMGEEKINLSQLKEYQPPKEGVDPLRYKEEREGGLRVYQKGNTLYWANDPASKRPPLPPRVHP
jgi:hypothetical protein